MSAGNRMSEKDEIAKDTAGGKRPEGANPTDTNAEGANLKGSTGVQIEPRLTESSFAASFRPLQPEKAGDPPPAAPDASAAGGATSSAEGTSAPAAGASAPAAGAETREAETKHPDTPDVHTDEAAAEKVAATSDQASASGAAVSDADFSIEAQLRATEEALEATQKERDALHDKYLRAHAEMENFKKRSRRTQQEQLRYAQLPLLSDLLSVIDHLELALQHGKQQTETLPKSVKGLLAGVEMVRNDFLDRCQKHGLKRIETEHGVSFDPHLHEAVASVESAELPDNRVVAVFQAGYHLHDRVLRPARVSVSGKTQN